MLHRPNCPDDLFSPLGGLERKNKNARGFIVGTDHTCPVGPSRQHSSSRRLHFKDRPKFGHLLSSRVCLSIVVPNSNLTRYLQAIWQGNSRRTLIRRSEYVHQQRQDRLRHGQKHIEDHVGIDRHEPDMPASRGNSEATAAWPTEKLHDRRFARLRVGRPCAGRGHRFPFIRGIACRTLASP